MYLLTKLKIFLLLFVITVCDKINENDSVQYNLSSIVSIRFDCQNKNDPMTHCCSGTIVSELYILTAADCVHNLSTNVTAVTIVIGIPNQSKTKQIIRKIDQIVIHPNWSNDHHGVKHNIALLHLSSPLDFTVTRHINRIYSPIRINVPNALLSTIQWHSSTKNFDGTMSIRLQQTELFFVNENDPTCMQWINDNKQQFCARFYHRSNASCKYNSGELALQWIDNHWIQVGMISFIAANTNNDCLGIYTNLAYYHEWIESILISKSLSLLTIATTTDSITNLTTIYECDLYRTSCGCSAENVELSSTRIIGGEEAIPFSWTMTVSVRLNDSVEHSCGGSILTSSYILTSARCVDGVSMMEMSIVAGIHNRIEDFPNIRYVHDIYIHPNWNASDGTYQNDIAILRIFPPLLISSNGAISRTCVPYLNSVNETVNYPLNNSHLIITGWGSIQDSQNNMSDTLQQASVYVIDNNDPLCIQSIHDVESQFCAGINGGDPCQGDLGGPIFQWKGTYWEQVGITSYGGRCDQIGSPSVYTRLAYYFDWMETVINSSLTTTTLPPTPKPASYVCNKTASCGCGNVDVALTTSRIVGGENALKDSWPMIVSLRFYGSTDHSCGGTIVSNSYILTAAHCLRQIPIENITDISIAAGMTNRSDPLQIIRNVDRIYMHPNYTTMPRDYRHDIALVHIDKPFVFETNTSLTRTCIHRIDPPISTNEYPKSGTRLAVIGWGVLRFGTSYLPDILQQAQVFTINNEDPICVNSINNTEIQFCAGLLGGGKDSCQGDSGGPIFQWTGQYWEQVGIVSHGKGCAQANAPGIYTRLSYYYQWMEEILKQDGEHLEPEISSYITTTWSSSTTPTWSSLTSTTSSSTATTTWSSSTSTTSSSTTSTAWSSSTTTKTTTPNGALKYEFNMLILGSFIFLLLLF